MIGGAGDRRRRREWGEGEGGGEEGKELRGRLGGDGTSDGTRPPGPSEILSEFLVTARGPCSSLPVNMHRVPRQLRIKYHFVPLE